MNFEAFQQQSLANRPSRPIVLDEPIDLAELPTPALVVDLEPFERNLTTMGAWLDQHGMRLRAHAKMHKCPEVARRQLAAGAAGICTATVSEAEVMQASGIAPILITSPVVSQDKLARVVALAATNPQLQIVVDNAVTASRLNALAREAGIRIGVMVDVDPGMGRTGIAPGTPALDLGRHVLDRCPALRFDGLQMYAGNCMHVEGHQARRARYFEVMAAGRSTLEMFRADGIDVPVFTGGGTGSYDFEPELGLVTDLQAGSYAFMDMEYRDIGSRTATRFEDFEAALFVLVTAISQPQDRAITVDAGFKSFASDKMVPECRDIEGVRFRWGGDEHGILMLDNPSARIGLGDRLWMAVPHCDPTVNLYDYLFPVRGGVVRELWPISARGCSQ
ncbi:MAG: DSD1 family PLP-dependent enzyme [Proteobacteria bacterium]|nr:DSD1 family PLP-dependent enzyme [Pseudomonadota bacterium]